MTFEELKQKALSLPLSPGVYLMKDKDDNVIYVGKAKKLKNRVSQYFQDTANHSAKTRKMVAKIHHFDVLIAASEFEALVLECSLIKRHMPKYNILLKDGKGYPYLRLNINEPYPRLTMVNKPEADGAEYYGPFGSRGITKDILEAINHALKFPNCNRRFPQDIGKDRPCLNYHMGQCEGWCQAQHSQQEYLEGVKQIRQLLSGKIKEVTDELRRQMIEASDALKFELAASVRDRLNAIEALTKKQLVTAGAKADMDVIGYGQTETNGCFTVLHFSDGNLVDKDFEVLPLPDNRELAVSSLMKQYYLYRGFAPRFILLPFDIEDRELFEQLLAQQYGRKTTIKIPQRGDSASLVSLANKNATEEAERVSDRESKVNATWDKLSKMLNVPCLKRVESYDISNLMGTDIVGGMVVFQEGKPRKCDYKRFKIKSMENQDDYASMQQVLMRRFTHYIQGDAGFNILPDLLLIDGGITHATVAEDVLQQLNLTIPVFGMVKDDKHRTRALVNAEGFEIQIDVQPAVFALVGNIQEETHRFAISYHKKLRSKRLKYSQLDAIEGVGPKRKQQLLRAFKSVSAIRAASLQELEQHLPKNVAFAVYTHFKTQSER